MKVDLPVKGPEEKPRTENDGATMLGLYVPPGIGRFKIEVRNWIQNFIGLRLFSHEMPN